MDQATATAPIVTQGDLGVNAASFARHLRASNLAPRTIKTYLEGVARLAAFLERQGMPTDVAAIRREHVEAFIADLLETSRPATAANRYRSVQAFFKWAEDEGEIKASPMLKMRPPKIPEEPVDFHRLDDVRKLIEACSGPRFEDRRDEAILRTFVSTGIRLAELAAMRWTPDDPATNDLDLDTGLIRVMGKGRRERVIPVGNRTTKALDRYIRVRSRHRYADSSALWLAAKGPFTYSGIAQMVRDRGSRAGLGERVHPHQLRHLWAHEGMEAGMSESDLMALGGWRSREMLRRYGSKLQEERAIKAGRRLNPGDRL
jgi:site-specific recombinase XerD